MKALEMLHAICMQHGTDKTYWIAYSGGLDSSVLLALASELKHVLPLKLHAIHIHHGLNAHADEWVKHCQQVCADYDIPLDVHYLQLNITHNIEASARSARYAVFAEKLQAGDVLLTAHHENDQAETLLLQLMRGAGTKGLAAMPVEKVFARGIHARPLLSCSRNELLSFAQQKHLSWVEDSSNQDITLTRNLLRHDVLPLLEKTCPAVIKNLARSATHCAESEAILAVLAQQWCEACVGSKANTLALKKLLSFDEKCQRLILRYWIRAQGFALPSTKKLERIQTTLLHAAEDKMPCVMWENAVMRRYREDIYLARLQDISLMNESTLAWDLQQPLMLQVGTLYAERVQGRGIRNDLSIVKVDFRKGGEKLQMLNQHQSLKKLLQNWGVPPWERACLPLISVGQKIVNIPGYYLHPHYAAKADEYGWEIALR